MASCGQVNLKKLKSLRGTFNLEIEKERRQFLAQLYDLIENWKGHLPDLRDIFRPGEIDWLLTESVELVNFADNMIYLTTLVEFVIATGYNDKPDINDDDKPLLLRTTPIHYAFRCRSKYNVISVLFGIYGFDVNYADESGLTHFHVACVSRGCYDVVEKFLELGQDPNLIWQQTGDSPLHLVYKYCEFGHEDIVRALLNKGANPNSADAEGLTPLHIICLKNVGNSLVEIFFQLNDENNQRVQVDVRDNLGQTPLQIAVANLTPHVVGLLLDRGADLSNFIFPPSSDFVNRCEPNQTWHDFKLKLATDVVGVIGHLEKRGYELDRSDALTMMKFFAKYELFEKLEKLQGSWYDSKEFVRQAKNVMIIPRKFATTSCLSLYDLTRLRPEEAEKRFTYQNFYEYHLWVVDWLPLKDRWLCLRCAEHLCEKISRRFFRRWALVYLFELTRYQLPILCCEKIIENLKNEHLYNICLAATIQDSQ